MEAWQHPFANVFKHHSLEEWKNADKAGAVESKIDRVIGKQTLVVTGSISASNYFRLPSGAKSPITPSKASLNLTGKIAYVEMRAHTGKHFTFRLDVMTVERQVLQLCFSNLYKTPKLLGNVAQVPVQLDTSWTILALRMPELLEEASGGACPAASFLCIKAVEFCSTMTIRGFYTSDFAYTHQTLPRDMAFPVHQGETWESMYRFVWLPPGSGPDANSSAVSSGALDTSGASAVPTSPITVPRPGGSTPRRGPASPAAAAPKPVYRPVVQTSVMTDADIAALKKATRVLQQHGVPAAGLPMMPEGVDAFAEPASPSPRRQQSVSTPRQGTQTVTFVTSPAPVAAPPATPAAGLPTPSSRKGVVNPAALRAALSDAGGVSATTPGPEPTPAVVPAPRAAWEDGPAGAIPLPPAGQELDPLQEAQQRGARALAELEGGAVLARQESAFGLGERVNGSKAPAISAAVRNVPRGKHGIPADSTLQPDPIMQLSAIMGMSGDVPRTVVFTPDCSEIVFPCGHMIVSMQSTTADPNQPRAQRHFQGHTSSVCCLTLSRNGDKLASGQVGSPGTIRVWNFVTGACVATLSEHHSSLQSVSFSHDGDWLVGCGLDDHARVLLVVWDLSDVARGRHSVVARQVSDFGVNRILFSPYEPGNLVSCGKENIRFWRITKAHARGCPVVLNQYARNCTFTDLAFEAGYGARAIEKEAQRRVFVATSVGTVMQVNYDTRALECVFRLHSDVIHSIAVNEGFCVTASADKYLRVWPLDFADYFLEAQHKGPVTSCGISADGLSIVAGTAVGTIGILDVSTHEYHTLLRTHTGQITGLAVRPPLTGVAKRNIAGRQASALVLESSTQPLMPSAGEVATVSVDGTVRVWNLDTRDAAYEFECIGNAATCVAYHPRAHQVVCGFQSGHVRIMDVPSTRVVEEFYQHKAAVLALAFLADGSLLFSAAADGLVVVYDAEQHFSPVKTLSAGFLPGCLTQHAALAVSPDCSLLAVTIGQPVYADGAPGERADEEDVSGCVRLLSPRTLVLQSTLRLQGATRASAIGRVSATPTKARRPSDGAGASDNGTKERAASSAVLLALTFSPDSSMLVASTSDRRLVSWNVESGRMEKEVRAAHRGTIQSVAFQPGGGYILSGGADRLVKVWEAVFPGPPPPLFQAFGVHADAVQAIAWTNDCKRVLSVGGSAALHIWDWLGSTGTLLPVSTPSSESSRGGRPVANEGVVEVKEAHSDDEDAERLHNVVEEMEEAVHHVEEHWGDAHFASDVIDEFVQSPDMFSESGMPTSLSSPGLVSPTGRQALAHAVTDMQVAVQHVAAAAALSGESVRKGVDPLRMAMVAPMTPSSGGHEEDDQPASTPVSMGMHSRVQSLQRSQSRPHLHSRPATPATNETSSGSEDGANLSDSEELGDVPLLPAPHRVVGVDSSCNGVVWIPSQAMLAYASDSHVIVENLLTRDHSILDGVPSRLGCLAGSVDGRLLAGAGSAADGFGRFPIVIWRHQVPDAMGTEDVAVHTVNRGWEAVGSLCFHDAPVVDMAFSNNGNLLASVCVQGSTLSLAVWDVASGSVLGSGTVPVGAAGAGVSIASVAWAPWTEMATTHIARQLSLETVASEPDGPAVVELVTAAGSACHVWKCNVNTGSLRSKPVWFGSDATKHVTSVAFAREANGMPYVGGTRKLVALGNSQGTIDVWEFLPGAERDAVHVASWQCKNAQAVLRVAWAGQVLVCGGVRDMWALDASEVSAATREGKPARVQTPHEWKRVTLDGHVVGMAFDGIASRGVVATYAASIWYVDWTTPVRLCSGHMKGIAGLASAALPLFSGASKGWPSLAVTAGGADGSVRLWDTGCWDQIVQLQVDKGVDARCVAMNNAGVPAGGSALMPTWSAIGLSDGGVRLVRLDWLKCVAKISVHTSPVSHVAWAGAGSVLISGDAKGEVWLAVVPCDERDPHDDSLSTRISVKVLDSFSEDAAAVAEGHAHSPVVGLSVSQLDSSIWCCATANGRVSVWRCHELQSRNGSRDIRLQLIDGVVISDNTTGSSSGLWHSAGPAMSVDELSPQLEALDVEAAAAELCVAFSPVHSTVILAAVPSRAGSSILTYCFHTHRVLQEVYVGHGVSHMMPLGIQAPSGSLWGILGRSSPSEAPQAADGGKLQVSLVLAVATCDHRVVLISEGGRIAGVSHPFIERIRGLGWVDSAVSSSPSGPQMNSGDAVGGRQLGLAVATGRSLLVWQHLLV